MVYDAAALAEIHTNKLFWRTPLDGPGPLANIEFAKFQIKCSASRTARASCTCLSVRPISAVVVSKFSLGILKFLAPPCFATSPRSRPASLLRRGNLRGVAHQTAVGAASPLFDH